MSYEYSVNMKSGVIENDKHYFCIRFNENPLLDNHVVGVETRAPHGPPERWPSLDTKLENIELSLSMSPGLHELLKNPPPFAGNLILVGAKRPLFDGSSVADPSAKSKISYVSDISPNGKMRVKFKDIPPMTISRKNPFQWEPIDSIYSHLSTVSLRPISDDIIANTLKLPEELSFRL